MTNRELIELLKTFPTDEPVFRRDADWGILPLKSIEIGYAIYTTSNYADVSEQSVSIREAYDGESSTDDNEKLVKVVVLQ